MQGCSGGNPAYACQPGYECIDNWFPIPDECRAKGCVADGCPTNYECDTSGTNPMCNPTVRCASHPPCTAMEGVLHNSANALSVRTHLVCRAASPTAAWWGTAATCRLHNVNQR